MERRRFLKRVTLGISALIGGLLSVPAAVFLVGPARRGEAKGPWIPVAAAADVPIGVPTLLSARLDRESGWVMESELRTFYAITDDGSSYLGLSTICSHLGCRVRFAGDRFLCPCHNAEFDRHGEVLSGPPPKALEHYEMKSEAGTVYVRFGGEAT